MILIVDMNWKKNSLGYYEFVLPIVSVVSSMDSWVVKHYLEVTSKDLSQCRCVILSGTALKDTATLRQPAKFQWLMETGKPVLGICAGMETISMVYGCRLVESLEIGMTQISVLKRNPLFSEVFRAYSLHSICVETESLVDFEVWGKSEYCTQVIKHMNKPIYGMLFHPEVRNPELIKRFINL